MIRKLVTRTSEEEMWVDLSKWAEHERVCVPYECSPKRYLKKGEGNNQEVRMAGSVEFSRFLSPAISVLVWSAHG